MHAAPTPHTSPRQSGRHHKHVAQLRQRNAALLLYRLYNDIINMRTRLHTRASNTKKELGESWFCRGRWGQKWNRLADGANGGGRGASPQARDAGAALWVLFSSRQRRPPPLTEEEGDWVGKTETTNGGCSLDRAHSEREQTHCAKMAEERGGGVVKAACGGGGGAKSALPSPVGCRTAVVLCVKGKGLSFQRKEGSKKRAHAARAPGGPGARRCVGAPLLCADGGEGLGVFAAGLRPRALVAPSAQGGREGGREGGGRTRQRARLWYGSGYSVGWGQRNKKERAAAAAAALYASEPGENTRERERGSWIGDGCEVWVCVVSIAVVAPVSVCVCVCVGPRSRSCLLVCAGAPL